MAALLGCSRKSQERSAAQSGAPVTSAVEVEATRIVRASSGRPQVKMDTWSLGRDRELAVTYPLREESEAGTTKYPVLIALHGRGEAHKAPKDGAMGWFRDYALLTALERVCAPPLLEEDFRSLVLPERLLALNHALASQPFRGLVVVCPNVPDLDLRTPAQVTAYGKYLVETVLPSVHERTPSLRAAASTGIDGVSLGGAIALQTGFEHPTRFGAVGGIQPALQSSDSAMWAEWCAQARRKNPDQKLRLLTSERDFFRDGIGNLSQALFKRSLQHEFLDAPGPHDYIFNRGPGAYELLFFHERNLAREA
jgi:iron(III)-salmochelin esterase